MDYKNDDKETQVNSSSHFDDIDEFFLRNFNILLDDKKPKEENNIADETVEILDLDEQNEEPEVLDIDILDDNNEVEEIEVLDDIETNNNENINLNPELNIFFGLNNNVQEEVEILENLEDNKNIIEILDDIDVSNQNNEVEILDINEGNINSEFVNVVNKNDTLNSLNEKIEIPDDFELKSIEKIINLEKQNVNPLNYQETIEIEKQRKLENKKIRNKRTKKLILINLLILILICLAFVVYKIINWKIDNDHINEQIKEVQENVVIEEIEDNENTIIIEPSVPEEVLPDNDYYNFINVPLMNVDLNNLKEKNNDTIGWLKVNGTNINYPVVQSINNDYYINHSFDRSYNDGGWIFADYRNNLVDDKNLIIYGHARLNSTMFGTLKNVTKSSWYTNSENHLIKLSTINSNTLWQVFSTYIIDNESYYIKTDFSRDEEYLSFLNTIKNRSVYNYGVSVGTSDRILTLSTCYVDNKRVVLHAKLIKMENR